MYCVKKVLDNIYWVGGNDRKTALFENMFPIPNGVSYNSYLILDEKTVLLDTVDHSISREFMENIEHLLGERNLDYIIVNHMEPDHCAIIGDIVLKYPEIQVVGNAKTFQMIEQFFPDIKFDRITVKEGDCLEIGKRKLNFYFSPMVHWPEAMVTFESVDGVLFSADAFGTFGALDGNLFADEYDFERVFLEDARRYYTNIVGKFGKPVQSLLSKAYNLDIKCICPLHGPVWRENIGYFVDKYNKWSSYEAEEKGVMIVYASMYGNTENVANALAFMLSEKGIKNIKVYDVSTTHISQLVADTFKYSHIVLASPTYNAGIYPIMENYIRDIKALNVQNKTVAIVDNGTWANTAGKQMIKEISEMKNMNIIEKGFSILSSVNKDRENELNEFVDEIVKSFE